MRRVKHASVDVDLSLSVFVERALEDYLARLDRADGGEPR